MRGPAGGEVRPRARVLRSVRLGVGPFGGARVCLEVPQPAAPRPRRRPAALSLRPDTRNVSGRTSALPDAPWNTARSAMDFETDPRACLALATEPAQADSG